VPLLSVVVGLLLGTPINRAWGGKMLTTQSFGKQHPQENVVMLTR
jgi:hypothetical protein